MLFTFFSDATIARAVLARRPRVAAPQARLPAHRHPDLGDADRRRSRSASTDRRRRCSSPGSGSRPQPDWLLIPLLLLELYVFTLGVALILSRRSSCGCATSQQVWELALQLLFYASPIIYPIGFLPPWARKLAFLNPFTQVLQDIRALVLYPDLAAEPITADDRVRDVSARLVPIAIAFGTLVVGYLYFRREEPWFAERV